MCLASCHQGQLCKIISIVWISHQQLSLERCLWFSRLMGRPGRSAMGGGEKQQFLCSLPLTLACYTGFLIKTKQGTLWTRCFGSTTKEKACDSKSGVIHSICEPTCTSDVGSSWILAAGCSYFFSLIYLQPPPPTFGEWIWVNEPWVHLRPVEMRMLGTGWNVMEPSWFLILGKNSPSSLSILYRKLFVDATYQFQDVPSYSLICREFVKCFPHHLCCSPSVEMIIWFFSSLSIQCSALIDGAFCLN